MNTNITKVTRAGTPTIKMIKTTLPVSMIHLWLRIKVNIRNYNKIAFLSICAATLPAFSIAQEIPYERCFHEAAKRYSVEPALLMALAHVESRLKPDAINARSETDKDIGIMQIWTDWLDRLEQYNITEDVLLNQPCININVGAWILAENFASHGMNLTSLGAYNAGFSKKNEKIRTAYVEKVIPQLYHYRKIIKARKFHE